MNSHGLVSDSILITVLCADLMVQHALKLQSGWSIIWGISAVIWAVISIFRVTS